MSSNMTLQRWMKKIIFILKFTKLFKNLNEKTVKISVRFPRNLSTIVHLVNDVDHYLETNKQISILYTFYTYHCHVFEKMYFSLPVFVFLIDIMLPLEFSI
jgi:hypothetical protein